MGGVLSQNSADVIFAVLKPKVVAASAFRYRTELPVRAAGTHLIPMRFMLGENLKRVLERERAHDFASRVRRA